jgi:hypothetical protein
VHNISPFKVANNNNTMISMVKVIDKNTNQVILQRALVKIRSKKTKRLQKDEQSN